MNMTLKPSFLGSFVLALLVSGCATIPSAPGRHTQATSAVLDLFQKHPVVGLGEPHRGRVFHAFFLELVSHPRFAETVDDVVIE
jgi:hypothetical protein